MDFGVFEGEGGSGKRKKGNVYSLSLDKANGKLHMLTRRGDYNF